MCMLSTDTIGDGAMSNPSIPSWAFAKSASPPPCEPLASGCIPPGIEQMVSQERDNRDRQLMNRNQSTTAPFDSSAGRSTVAAKTESTIAATSDATVPGHDTFCNGIK